VRRYAADLDNQALAAFVRTLLRTVHADAFADWWRIDLRLLERRTDLDRDRLLRGLRYLQDRGVVQWRPPGAALQLDLSFPRARRLPVDDSAVQQARRRAEERLDYMIRYAQSVSCRRRFLLTYFGETSDARCGTCDVCMGRHRPEVVTPDDEPLLRQILECVDAATPRDAWFDDPPRADYRIDQLVDWLVDRGHLRLDDPLDGTYVVTEKGEAFLS
jgi:ATP-dependent DNA helicase RecQ